MKLELRRVAAQIWILLAHVSPERPLNRESRKRQQAVTSVLYIVLALTSNRLRR
jgi:hypothetical protein